MQDLFIIAEIGINHQGRLDNALRLADAAKEAGADAVKTQVWTTEEVYARTDPRFDTIKAVELDYDQVGAIYRHCRDIGIEFFATPDDIGWAHFLKGLGVKRIKTSSQDVTNLPFLFEIGCLGLPVIYSTGACTLDEMKAGYAAIRRGAENAEFFGDGSFPSVLHCVSSYPAPHDQMNLRMLKEIFQIWGEPLAPFGLSDHTGGSMAAVVAVGFGATIFEKHLTLDAKAAGPDHAASLEPGHFAGYVKSIREAHAMLGDGVKRIMPCEIETRKHGQRYAALRVNVPEGHRLTWDDLCFMKIDHGVDPQRARDIIDRGARTAMAYLAGTSLANMGLDSTVLD